MKTSLLTNLGISENAAKLYFAALGLGTASIQDLANKADLKRPTAYQYVEELLKEGLLEKAPLGKREYYRAIDPGVIETRAQQALARVQSALPDLQAEKSETEGRPSVTVLEGHKGVEQIYQELTEANALRFWSNLGTFRSVLGDTGERLSTAIHDRQIHTREIVADTPESLKEAKRLTKVAGPTHSFRLASSDGIQNDSVIYGNVVALFRIRSYNLFVVRIEDKTIAESMRALFDMAWNSAEPLG